MLNQKAFWMWSLAIVVSSPLSNGIHQAHGTTVKGPESTIESMSVTIQEMLPTKISTITVKKGETWKDVLNRVTEVFGVGELIVKGQKPDVDAMVNLEEIKGSILSFIPQKGTTSSPSTQISKSSITVQTPKKDATVTTSSSGSGVRSSSVTVRGRTD